MLNEFRSTLITWDKATSRIYSPITANESDENGRKLVVQIVNSGQVEDLTGATLHLYWETRDKAHDGLDVFEAVDLEKGEFELSYTTGMLSNKGVLNANLVLIDTVGRVVSERFKITVTEGIDNDAIQSENSFSSLTEALIDVSNLEQNYAPRLNDLTAQLQQTEQNLNAQLAQNNTQFENYNELLPEDFFERFPYPFTLKPNGEAEIEFNTKSIIDGADAIIYVDNELGGDSPGYGDGTKDKPFESIDKAWSVINEDTWTKAIIFVKGDFRRTTHNTVITVPANKTLSIIGYGDALLYAGDSGINKTWTVDGSVYKASSANTQNVIDRTVPLDKDGLPEPLKKVDTLALCQNTPNTWYSDNVNVWVHTHDGRQPDKDVFVLLFHNGMSHVLEENATLLLKNITRFGSMNPKGTNGKGRFIQENVKSIGGGFSVQSNGLSATNIKETISIDSITAYNFKDGFNYHYANTPEAERKYCFALELNCHSYENGKDAGDQASTMHEGVMIIRVKGKYEGHTGSAIVDVGGADSLIVNSLATSKVGFAIDSNGVDAKLYLISSSALAKDSAQTAIRAQSVKMRNNFIRGTQSVVE